MASMNNYGGGGGGIGEFTGERPGAHSLPLRSGGPSSSRATGRFAPPAQTPTHQEPWDQIQDEQRSEVMDCFSLFDMNKDGLLDFSEFRYALQALGFPDITRQDLIANFKARATPRRDWTPLPSLANQPAPPQQPGVVDLRLSQDGFQAIAASYILNRDPREELLKTFALFDKQNRGMVTIDDLRTVVQELGEDVPESELRSMIEQFDVEDKGGVGREEFLGIFTSG